MHKGSHVLTDPHWSTAALPIHNRDVVLLLEWRANVLCLDQRRKIHGFGCQIFVRNLGQEMADDVEAGGFLVFRVDDKPRSLFVVSVVIWIVFVLRRKSISIIL